MCLSIVNDIFTTAKHIVYQRSMRCYLIVCNDKEWGEIEKTASMTDAAFC